MREVKRTIRHHLICDACGHEEVTDSEIVSSSDIAAVNNGWHVLVLDHVEQARDLCPDCWGTLTQFLAELGMDVGPKYTPGETIEIKHPGSAKEFIAGLNQ